MKTLRTIGDKGSFLRSDTKCWVGSSLFFMCIAKLGMNDKIYHIPIGIDCTNEDLAYYVGYLFDELGYLELHKESWTQEEKEAKAYVTKVGFILRTWAREGHGIRIV